MISRIYIREVSIYYIIIIYHHIKIHRYFFMYYRSFSGYLRERFGQKVFRVSLDAGFTCPNRNGTYGLHGCAYCSPGGSWNERGECTPLLEQVRMGKEAARNRYGASKFIAYFQAFTNTYAPAGRLKEVYDSVVLKDKEFVGLAIGTRPDCIDREKLELIESYRKLGLMVWIEYGLQTSNNHTLKLINRGHTAEDFSRTVLLTKEYDILVSTHVIIGLPGECREENLETAHFLSELPIDGIKIHNLNIVEGTRIAEMYRSGMVHPVSLEEFAQRVVDFLEHTNPQVVVDRLVAETKPALLIEPKWSLNKQAALQAIIREFRKRNSFQGRFFYKSAI